MINHRFARFVSIILSAPMTSAVPCVFLPEFSGVNPQSLMSTVLVGLLLLAIAPISLVWLISKVRKFEIDVPDRKSRLRLFPLPIFCQISAVVGFVYLKIPSMITFSILSLSVTLSIFLLNFRFKASIHSAALAGSTTALVAAFGAFALPGYLLLIPVIWARRSLRIHDMAELLVGALVGTVIGLILYNISLISLLGTGVRL